MKNKTIIGSYIILISGLIVMAFINVSDKDKLKKEITDLKNKNSELIIELDRKKKDNQMLGITIESLLDQVEGKKAIECECEWLQAFYDEYHEEVGAFE